MRKKAVRLALVATALLAMMLMATGTAYAEHVTDRSASSVDTTVSLESTGDAGQFHGNANPGTSPVDGSGNFYWFNQDVRVFDFEFADAVDVNGVEQTGGTYAINTGAGYGTPVDFTGEPVLNAEGVYSIVGSGVDAIDLSTPEAGTAIEPAFGIDKTKPTSSSDATAAYVGGSATINIDATDAMSGVQDVRTSLDSGPWDYTFDGTTGDTLVQVTTLVPGSHTLTWQAFDNAGNMESHTVAFIVYLSNTVDINASAGANGQISPSGVVAATVNADQAFTITPDAHYHVADVLVDGSSVGAVTSYTFPHVTVGHTISASFAIDTNNINASAGANGAISPSGVTAVGYGGSQMYNIQPYSGFRVSDVLVDGVSVGPVSSYTFTNVTTAHTVSATFTAAFPTAFVPFVSLKTGFPGKNHHNVRFFGGISQMAAASTLRFTIQRKSGRNWVRLTSFSVTLPAMAGSFAVTKNISRNGTFRVQATDSCGASKWVTFKTN